VPEPAATGADDDRHGIRGLVADVDDPAAQVGAGAQRVDEVEVVAGHERGGQGLDDAARAADHAADRAGSVGTEAGTRHPGLTGGSVDGGGTHYASVTYGNVTYESVTTAGANRAC
jgi:hypothetical protein